MPKKGANLGDSSASAILALELLILDVGFLGQALLIADVL